MKPYIIILSFIFFYGCEENKAIDPIEGVYHCTLVYRSYINDTFFTKLLMIDTVTGPCIISRNSDDPHLYKVYCLGLIRFDSIHEKKINLEAFHKGNIKNALEKRYVEFFAKEIPGSLGNGYDGWKYDIVKLYGNLLIDSFFISIYQSTQNKYVQQFILTGKK